MTNTAPQRLIDNMRGVRYGEVLAMFLRDTGLEAEVYGTQMLNDCPQELWETLDADAIAKDMGAVFVKLNGLVIGCLMDWVQKLLWWTLCLETSMASKCDALQPFH